MVLNVIYSTVSLWQMFKHTDSLFPMLLKTLSDESDEVSHRNFQSSQLLTYQAQLFKKKTSLTGDFKRLGGFSRNCIITCRSDGHVWVVRQHGYQNRAPYSRWGQRWAASGGWWVTNSWFSLYLLIYQKSRLIPKRFYSTGSKVSDLSPSTPSMNSYFYKFMINLLKRFSLERKLLEMRGAFIIR